MHTACVWSVKLPFAEYSVEKERSVAFTPCVSARVATFEYIGCDKLLLVTCHVTFQSRAGRTGYHRPRQTGAAHRRVFNQSGEYRARTGDLLVANQALSQLS
jgi:hypothetical protein